MEPAFSMHLAGLPIQSHLQDGWGLQEAFAQHSYPSHNLYGSKMLKLEAVPEQMGSSTSPEDNSSEARISLSLWQLPLRNADFYQERQAAQTHSGDST